MWNKKGFTLIEITIVLGILSAIFLITGDIIINSLKTTRFESEQATAIEHARKSMNIITKEIRGANTSEKGDYPLALAQTNELIFFNDINHDDMVEKIRYYLKDTSLMREIFLPGASKNYSTLSQSNPIAMYVNNKNLPIFSYYDSNSIKTTTISQIRMIRTDIIINVKPATAPNDYALESDVSLRNLKD